MLMGLLCHAEVATAIDLQFVAEPYPPFVVQIITAGNEPRVEGPFAEIVRAVCSTINARCGMRVVPWRRAYEMTKAGQVDGIFPIQQAPEREAFFFFSDTVIESATAVFAQNKSTFRYNSPSSFDGYTVGVYGPSAAFNVVNDLLTSGSTGKTYVTLSNSSTLKMLANGRFGDPNHGLAVVNRDVGQFILESEGIRGIRVVQDLKGAQLRIAFSRLAAKDASYKAFNAALQAFVREGGAQKILDRYDMKAPK
jgi:polar amino acid transport system substrate-binding protein